MSEKTWQWRVAWTENGEAHVRDIELQIAVEFTADQWRAIFNAVGARAESIGDAREIRDRIEAALEDCGETVWK